MHKIKTIFKIVSAAGYIVHNRLIVISNLVYNKARLFCTLQWRHNERDGLSNHQPHDCLLNSLFGRRSQKTWKLRVTGLCEGNSPVPGEFPAQKASNAENISIWWRNHGWISNYRGPYCITSDHVYIIVFSPQPGFYMIYYCIVHHVSMCVGDLTLPCR